MGLDSKVLPESFLRRMAKADRAPMGKAGLTRPEIDAKSAAKREKEIQESIAQYLRLREIPFHQARMDRKTTGPVGWPDFTFCYCGRFVALEVKAGGNTTTPDQRSVLAALEKQGAYCKVVFSLVDAIALLGQVEKDA